jgi:putative pyruvate formate lyase activating enzyme
MQKQVGDLKTENGVAKKGLIVRHLILPNAIENTKGCLKFIISISKKVHLSLMSQYNPCYKAFEYGELSRPINKEEFIAAQKLVEGFGFKNGWIQEFGGSVKNLNPDFRRKEPFGE